ncbi:membrane dipeptidase [Glaciihabitans tibetensis]|uniref:Membrane dipeptidase n=1 Tax=Glaciihabitans tibetensis TaxID=1266600 RepID=A0A2T0VIE4_9MICO|nr:dipeptidase [Glaciihabitans tibetensis]PRY70001.1 membrane dipeptidase [Glaciihabitans tibetensis]
MTNPAVSDAVRDFHSDIPPAQLEVVISALERCGVIDGHNDLAWVSRTARDYSVEGLDAGVTAVDTDIPRLRAGGVSAQFWSVFAPVDELGADAVRYTLEQIDFVYRLVERHPTHFALARSADDVRKSVASGRIASLLGAEGGHSISESAAVLRMFARLGVRYMTLTHTSTTTWADSGTDDPEHDGLSATGEDFVREMNRLGMLVDLSHVSAATAHGALDITSAPVIFSHSSCSTVATHPRNVSDDVLSRLAANGGVQMITFVPMFLSERYADWAASGQVGAPPAVTVADAADHVEHARAVAGLHHIGLGGDYDGTPDFPVGLEDVASYPRLLAELAGRGWNADELSLLTGRNILRVLEDTDAAFASAAR